YARNGSVDWKRVALVGPVAFAASLLGTLGYLEFLKRHANAVLPAFAVVFLLLAVYQTWRALRAPADPPAPRRRIAVGLLFVAAISLYDGCVGPGTGMFLFWAFTTWFAHGALDATGTTKAVNWITNAASLSVWITRGGVVWPVGLAMAAANLSG